MHLQSARRALQEKRAKTQNLSGLKARNLTHVSKRQSNDRDDTDKENCMRSSNEQPRKSARIVGKETSNVFGYNSQGKPYHTCETDSTFEKYGIFNLELLNRQFIVVGEHARHCSGNLFIPSDCESRDFPRYMSGGLFSAFKMHCTKCEEIFLLENDYFTSPPCPSHKDSVLTDRFMLGIRNISFVWEDFSLMWNMMGMNFITKEKHRDIEDKIGLKLLELTDETTRESLREEKRLAKLDPKLQSLAVRNLEVVTEADIEIDQMKGAMLTEILDEFNFPCRSLKVAEKKRCLKSLVQDHQTLRQQISAKYPSKEFTAISASYDGSWHRRSYTNNAKSPWGQGAWVGDLTKKVIGWDWRVLSCAICNRADNMQSMKVPEHLCAINHFGTIKSMESDIAISTARNMFQKEGVILKQVTTDGDATVHSVLQHGTLDCPVQRLLGSCDIIANKSDMRHFVKCVKDEIYRINTKNTIKALVGQNGRSTSCAPMIPKYDAPKLARVLNFIKIQISTDEVYSQKSLEDKAVLMQETIQNFKAHYFNDDPANHRSCQALPLNKCPVALAAKLDCISLYTRVIEREMKDRKKVSTIVQCLLKF